MDPKSGMRIAAVIVLAGAMLACAIDVARLHREPAPSTSSTDNQGNPSAAELARCKALGSEAANDASCKAAWAKSRERFFAPAQPYQGRPIDPLPGAPGQPAAAPSESYIERTPLPLPPPRQAPESNSEGR